MTNERRVEELLEAGSIEGTEIGEAWIIVAEIFNKINNREYFSEELLKAVTKELHEKYKEYKECFEWVEKEEVIKTKIRSLEAK